MRYRIGQGGGEYACGMTIKKDMTEVRSPQAVGSADQHSLHAV